MFCANKERSFEPFVCLDLWRSVAVKARYSQGTHDETSKRHTLQKKIQAKLGQIQLSFCTVCLKYRVVQIFRLFGKD